MHGLGTAGNTVTCPECGLSQRLDSEGHVAFARPQIIVITIVIWLVGGVTALEIDDSGSGTGIAKLVLLVALCAAAPSLLASVELARFINVPASLTSGERLVRAMWWWFMGSVLSAGIGALLLGGVPA